MRAFIYASGSAKRWARTGPGAEIPATEHKQLLEAGGVPIIVRTCRQLRERDCAVVVVTPHQDIVDAIREHLPNYCIDHSVDFMDVGQPKLLVETIEKSAPEWTEGLNIGLMGDTYFTDSAMDVMLRAKEMMFFGRPFPSIITGNMAQGEIFAWTWNMPEDEKVMRTAINLSIEDADSKPGERDKAGTPLGGLWQLYRGCVGDPLVQPYLIVRKKWRTLNDFTDDFDTPQNYTTWLQRYGRRIVKQPKIDLEARA